MRVEDELNGHTAEVGEPFVVDPAGES